MPTRPDLGSGAECRHEVVPPTRRCAIYTRKSSEEGLGQTFNSLQAQREAAEAYVASQRGEGWACLPNRYDDGGYSGGTLRRPALEQLLADVRGGKVDVVAVYKIDRLSRSLADFVRLVDIFESHAVSFVSITQAFDTTSSMGRLTLNVLLSFAQFEREIMGERIRDKFAASRARGLWHSGTRPLGYRLVDQMLVVDEADAAVVRHIFRRYPQIGSARRLAAELTMAGMLSHRGRRISPSYVLRKLQNRLYLGETVHRGRSFPGTHEPIVTMRAWDAAQAAIAESARRRAAMGHPTVPILLKGMVFGVTGHAMIHHFTRSRGRLYRYYVSTLVFRSGKEACPVGRLRAQDLENAVVAMVERLVFQPGLPTARPMRKGGWSGQDRDIDLMRRSEADRHGVVRRIVERVEVGLDGITLRLRTGGVVTGPVEGIARPVSSCASARFGEVPEDFAEGLQGG